MFIYFKNNHFFKVALVAAVTAVPSTFAQSEEIKLGGRADLVISDSVRAEVLKLSENLLSETEDSFAEDIASMESPFVFEQVEAIVADKASKEAIEPVVDYDDASVLNVVAENFARRVGGTLVRGSTSFLQLDGGTLLRPGASFPVSIPQAEDRSFTVTVTEITGNSYTLKLGDMQKVVWLPGTSGEGGGAVRSD
jgi:hypothetical protein